MADELSAFWDHFSHHAPNDMLTVLVVGIGIAAAAIAVLRLVGTKRRRSARWRPF
jgi:F0F1-type ATP synthase assembly protein I